MNFVLISEILLLGLLIYLFCIREYLYTKKQFSCLRCGDCCKLRVKLNSEDRKILREKGYSNFEDEEGFLRKINGNCIFFEMKKGIGGCEVETSKPKICKQFPNKKGIFGNKRDYRCRSCWQKKIHKK